MPRKKKEEKDASSKPKSLSKSTKPVKRTLKVTVVFKKASVQKPSAEPKAKPAKKPVKIKKEIPVSKSVRTSKTDTVTVPPEGTGTFKSLPRHGENQLVAFVRDPHCVFTYWEVTPERLEEVKKELKEEFKNSHMVLRLFNINPAGERILVDELRIEPGQVNRYVEIKQTGETYVLEIAQRTETGRYFSYAQSNPVTTFITHAAGSHGEEAHPVLTEEVSPEMLSYFHEQGYDLDSPPVTEFISSAENLKRLKRKKDLYKASFF